MLVTPPGRSGEAPLALADLRDDLFVCLPAGSGLRAILLDAARGAGFEPTIAFETDTPAGIRELVAAGLGVALLAESVARGPGPEVQLCTLPSAPAHPPLGTIRLRSRRPTPAARAWQHQLRQSYPTTAQRAARGRPAGPTPSRWRQAQAVLT